MLEAAAVAAIPALAAVVEEVVTMAEVVEVPATVGAQVEEEVVVRVTPAGQGGLAQWPQALRAVLTSVAVVE